MRIMIKFVNRHEAEFKIDPCANINFNAIGRGFKRIGLRSNFLAISNNGKIQYAAEWDRSTRKIGAQTKGKKRTKDETNYATTFNHWT